MKQADALTMARGIFPHMTEDELISVLWQQTDYPDALGDNPAQMLNEQLQAFKDLLIAHGATYESKQTTDNELQARIAELEAENERLRRMLYEMTTSLDWYHAGYDVVEYDALDKEFGVKL